MTEEVHALLLEAVELSGRSMNAEINMRLLDTFNKSSKSNTDLDETKAEAMHRRVLKKVLTEELGLIKEFSNDIKRLKSED